MKTRKTLLELLIELDACDPAIEWVEDRTIEEAVSECYRGDWMLWLAQRLEVDSRALTLAKGYCANTVKHLMKDERSIKAVDAAIAYGEGRICEEDLKEAAAAADSAAIDAYYDDDVAADATYAAEAAAAAADFADAADAASDAAYYAAVSRQQNQKQTADICRKYIGQLIIDKVNEI